MKKYFLNNQAQSNGDHEVHHEDCNYLPMSANRIFLGEFSTCQDAVRDAKKRFPSAKINGCYFCSYSCHTS